MNEDNLTGINRLPNEILIHIFSSLVPKSIMACRVVCWKWRKILDDPIISETLWYKHCKTYYNDIYQSAFLNSMPGLKWYHIYVSLSLWSQLPLARETIKEINFTKNEKEYCSDFQVLHNGVIGVLTKTCIAYYNVETLQLTQELALPDNNDYFSYNENDENILMINKSDQLFVRRTDQIDVVINQFDDIFLFLLLGNVIYYVTNSNTMFKCDFVEGRYTSSPLVKVPEKAMALGHDNGIPYVLTNTDDIYSYVNNALVKVPVSDCFKNKWKTISRYNFSGNSGWKNMCTYCIFSSFCKDDKDILDIYNIYHLRIHGPVMIVGYKFGVVHIFYSAYTTSLIYLLESEPLKIYYLLKPHEYLIDDVIFNIDVVEGYQSHTVIVALRFKLVIIKITHPDKSEEPLCTLKETTRKKVIKTRKPSTNWKEIAPGSSKIAISGGGVRLRNRKDSSSSGESSPQVKKKAR